MLSDHENHKGNKKNFVLEAKQFFPNSFEGMVTKMMTRGWWISTTEDVLISVVNKLDLNVKGAYLTFSLHQ